MAQASSFDGVFSRSALFDRSSESILPEWCDLLDKADPAFRHIVGELTRMMIADVEITPAAIEIATKLGQRRHRSDVRYEEHAAANRREQCVYYIRCGEFIKIGTTTDIERRMVELCPNEVLAIEPGDMSLEHERHKQFAEHRIRRREYFRPHIHLLAHIERVRREHGVPNINYVPLNSEANAS